MPVPHHSVFTGWMPFVQPNQQHQRTEGMGLLDYKDNQYIHLQYVQMLIHLQYIHMLTKKATIHTR